MNFLSFCQSEEFYNNFSQKREIDFGYSRVPNKHRPTFINFGNFFQGLRSYLRQLHYYLGVYVYCFSQFFPGSTLIWGPTLIRNSRVHTLNFNWKFQFLEYWRPLEALKKFYEITAPVWMDFKNSFPWLTGMKKQIFDYNNFFGSGYFLTFFQIWWIKKWPEPKKVVLVKN